MEMGQVQEAEIYSPSNPYTSGITECKSQEYGRIESYSYGCDSDSMEHFVVVVLEPYVVDKDAQHVLADRQVQIELMKDELRVLWLPHKVMHNMTQVRQVIDTSQVVDTRYCGASVSMRNIICFSLLFLLEVPRLLP